MNQKLLVSMVLDKFKKSVGGWVILYYCCWSMYLYSIAPLNQGSVQLLNWQINKTQIFCIIVHTHNYVKFHTAEIFVGQKFCMARLLLHHRNIQFHPCGKGCHGCYVIIYTEQKKLRVPLRAGGKRAEISPWEISGYTIIVFESLMLYHWSYTFYQQEGIGVVLMLWGGVWHRHHNM